MYTQGWVYLAALRGVTSGVTQAMLPRALAADGGGNASIRVSTDGKAGYISTTGDATGAAAYIFTLADA